MKILSTVDRKLIIQSERFEPGRLKISDPRATVGSIIVPILSFLIIYSDYNQFSHLFIFSYKSLLGILLISIELFGLLDVLFLKRPKYTPFSIFEIGTERILVREWKGPWYDPVITRVSELENIDSMDLVIDSKADISWDSDIGAYAMGIPQYSYQVVAKSTTGEQYELESNIIDILTIHPITLTAFCELIEGNRQSVREINKFLNESEEFKVSLDLF